MCQPGQTAGNMWDAHEKMKQHRSDRNCLNRCCFSNTTSRNMYRIRSVNPVFMRLFLTKNVVLWATRLFGISLSVLMPFCDYIQRAEHRLISADETRITRNAGVFMSVYPAPSHVHFQIWFTEPAFIAGVAVEASPAAWMHRAVAIRAQIFLVFVGALPLINSIDVPDASPCWFLA